MGAATAEADRSDAGHGGKLRCHLPVASGSRFRRWPVALVVLAFGLAVLAGSARNTRVTPRADVAPRGSGDAGAPDTGLPARLDGAGTSLDAASPYDLDADERLGGHTLARHVGRTDDQLAERLRREPQISAASTYTDEAAARRAVAAAIDASRERIEAWERRSGSRPNLVLSHAAPGRAPIGRSLARGARVSTPCTRALVVLRWLDRQRRWYVLTSYPEASR